ncbi:MAG TPA: Ig-like domain-containing protein, partial [Isosphaeraceae bacterium]|nr:Ig-like domain-containing protein [Isosphaeraceae bacterium]
MRVLLAWLLATLAWLPVAGAGEPANLTIIPSEPITLPPSGRAQILVSGTREGRTVDLTREVTFRSEPPGVVEVDEHGRLTARIQGNARVVASLGESRTELEVHVAGSLSEPTFERDIQPILARLGCNSGACHGKASGQNGFKLSLLGFDSDSDYRAITRDALGRRAWPGDPDGSLILTKATASLPHGGGPRLSAGDPNHQALRAWIASGMPRDPEAAPSLTGISVQPTQRRLQPGEEQQVAVQAQYSDGSVRDVTALSAFQSSDSALVDVDEDGLIRAGTIPGEAAITARFEGNFATCDIAIPLPGDIPSDFYASLPRRNFIDEHVWTKLQTLGLTPSEPASDSTFLRRAYLDAIG